MLLCVAVLCRTRAKGKGVLLAALGLEVLYEVPAVLAPVRSLQPPGRKRTRSIGFEVSSSVILGYGNYNLTVIHRRINNSAEKRSGMYQKLDWHLGFVCPLPCLVLSQLPFVLPKRFSKNI